MSGTLYLKWTGKGRVPIYQGGDPIPYRKWTPSVEWPVLCEQSWHACRWEDAPFHISPELWVCELDGRIVQGNDKVAASRLRLVRKVPIGDRELRLFAADCAEQVLSIFECEHPNDPRPREAIRVARLYAEGEATYGELAAARVAAWGAADAAKPAWAATGVARTARAAEWNAARAAAWAAAAWGAARAAGDTAAAARAATAVSWAWQAHRLLVHYGGLDPADFAHRGGGTTKKLQEERA